MAAETLRVGITCYPSVGGSGVLATALGDELAARGHDAVPHATAAILARAMLPPEQRPRLVTTLHGTDTTLLGQDAGYAPAIKHALTSSDAVTAVSQSLRRETERVLDFDGPIEVIH